MTAEVCFACNRKLRKNVKAPSAGCCDSLLFVCILLPSNIFPKLSQSPLHDLDISLGLFLRFSPFSILIVAKYRAITKTISESMCGKSIFSPEVQNERDFLRARIFIVSTTVSTDIRYQEK